MDELPELNRERIAIAHGQSWVADASLEFAGYTDVAVGDIIRSRINNFGDVYFEIEGPAKTKGIDNNITGWVKGWWIVRVDPDEYFRDLPITAEDDAR